MTRQILKKTVSILGMMVPISFVTSFAILISIHPIITDVDVILDLSFFGYNIEDIYKQDLIRFLNYFTVGLFIVLFAIGLILLLPKSFTNNLGAFFLLIVGLFWNSLAFFSYSEKDEGLSDYMLLAIMIIFISSFFSQLLLSNDIHKLVKSKMIKRSLLVAGFLMIIEFALCIFIPDFLITIPIFSVLFLIFNIGFLGYYLSKDYDFIDSE